MTRKDHTSEPIDVEQLKLALRRTRARYSTLLDNMQDGVFMTDAEGRFTFVNDFIERNSGFPAEWFIGKNFLDLIRPEDRDRIRRNFEAVLAGRKVPAYELAYFSKSGREMWVEVNTALLEEDGKAVGVFGLSRNIQKRKEMENALRESEAKYRTLVESLPYGVAIVQEGRVVFANQAIAQLIQGDPMDFDVLKDAPKFIAPSERKHLMDRLDKRTSGQKDLPNTYTTVLRRPDGQEYPVEIHAHAIEFQGKPAAQYVLIDISERQKLEDRIRQSQKMEAIGTLAGGVAHDFNNLLTGILGLASLLKLKSAEGDEVHESAAVIERAAHRAASLTRQLLGFARRGQLTRQPVEIHRVIDDVFDILGRTIDKRIELVRETTSAKTIVRGDPNQLQQVIMNLAVNARDAMARGGTLKVETDNVHLTDDPQAAGLRLPQGRYVKISVSDTGPGIPPDIRDRIFEPFFTTKPKGEGSGMGLAMAYGIVRNHGGTVHAEPGKEHGTVFRVYLPVSAESSPEVEPPAAEAVTGRGTILFVDDEEVVCATAEKMLTALGYNVVTEINPLSAVEYYREHKDEVDLVIIDLVMPKMGGRECFLALKTLNPQVKAVLSTGQGKNGAAEDLLKEGMVGFLEKPYLIDQLSEAVAGAMA